MWASNQIRPEDINSYVSDARDLALVQGLVLRYPSLPNDNFVAHAPITLFPSPFPRRLYNESLAIHPIISTLMLKIANDSDFIEKSLEDVVRVDDFTKNLLDINLLVRKEGLSQPITSCINRSDYMLDKYTTGNGVDSFRLRQVEVNAIASSMSSHSNSIHSIHQFLRTKYRNQPTSSHLENPKNESLQTVAQGIIDAFDAYGKEDSYVLFVTDERSFNFSDHVRLEQAVTDSRPDIRIVRRQFFRLAEIASLGPNKELLVDGNKEIALVYFRYGYDPSNYNFVNAWETRLLLERSRAIKCPSISFHLSGAKKFQQLLNNQEQLERFLSPEDSKRLSHVFCKFWSIESNTAKGEAGFNMGLSSNDRLVLKPQREGGGHNIYGKDVRSFLTSLTRPEDRSQYILMELINSAREKNWILTNDDKRPTVDIWHDDNDQLVSELGIYGGILAEGSTVRHNRTGGYLVRSKKFGVMEGGVASGHSGLSSLILIDDLSEDFDSLLYYNR